MWKNVLLESKQMTVYYCILLSSVSIVNQNRKVIIFPLQNMCVSYSLLNTNYPTDNHIKSHLHFKIFFRKYFRRQKFIKSNELYDISMAIKFIWLKNKN